jgi:hypothetical protein
MQGACGEWAHQDSPESAQAAARGGARSAPQILHRDAHAVSRSAARCASQVLERGAKAAARGAACCTPQVLDRGAQVDARGATTLPQQEKINSVNVQRRRVNITGCISTVVR